MKEANKTGKNIKIAGYLLIFLLLLCVGKAFWLQIIVADKYSKKAMAEIFTSITLPPKRGEITDRNGKVLSLSIDVASLYAHPNKINNKEHIAKQIAEVLHTNPENIIDKLQTEKSFVWIKRTITPLEAERISQIRSDAIGVLKEYARFYPNKELASQTIGFVNIDNRGIEGIEKALDFMLVGPEKKVILMRDARGKGFAVVKEEVGQKKVHHVVLTIDRELQHALEAALRKVVEERRALSANAVLMDCNTGEILAMATYPTYDPNNYMRYSPDSYRNRSITDVYEPGSVMKPFVFAIALEKGVITPMSVFDCENGSYAVAGKVIRDVHPYGALTAEQVIVKSSNIGATKIGDRVGYEEFYKFLRRIGFGSPLGIELVGERSGFLREPKKIRRIEEINTYFGQGVTVTTLQMVAGMAALVNGGYVVKPHVVKEIRDERGAVVRTTPVDARERVLSQRTSDIVKATLEKVTDTGGTGSKARVPMYSVGGKTGTAQKVDPNTKTYAQGRYISSFIGFAPAEYPRFVLGVSVDEPKGEYYGGLVAAPVFSEISAVALARLGLRPQIPSLTLAQSKKEGLLDSSLVETCLSMAQQNVLPDFKGMSIREVLNTARLLRIPVEIRGSGFAVRQQPSPGTGLNEVGKLLVEFMPPDTRKGG